MYEMTRTDEQIKKDVVDQLYWDSRVDASKVSVEVNDHVVTLMGELPTQLARSAALMDVSVVPGVVDVQNHATVVFPSVAEMPPPDQIQTNIERLLGTNAYIRPADIRIVFDNGVVTLEGTVDAMWKKDYAQDLVAHVHGVAEVHNRLGVHHGKSILDRTIAEDITAALQRNVLVDAEDIQVDVKGGIVKLRGMVPTWQARRIARDTALYTSGVVDVHDELKVSTLLTSNR
jgi:hyperosmotically inducible protein